MLTGPHEPSGSKAATRFVGVGVSGGPRFLDLFAEPPLAAEGLLQRLSRFRRSANHVSQHGLRPVRAHEVGGFPSAAAAARPT